MNLFSRLLGSLYLNFVSRHHQYCSTHWVDFINICGYFRRNSVWFSNLLLTFGYKYFYCFLHPLESQARKLLFERIRTGKPVLRLLPGFVFSRAYSTNSNATSPSGELDPLTINRLRELIGDLPLVDPNWLVGFTDAEGCFYVELRKNTSKVGYRVQLVFFIKQATVSATSLFAIREFFGKGHIRFDDSNKKYLRYEIKSHEAITQGIIPFFERYSLLTSKQLNFLDFKKVAELIKEGRHLTLEGIVEIQSIKANMNSRRAYSDKLEYMNSIREHIRITPAWLSGFERISKLVRKDRS